MAKQAKSRNTTNPPDLVIIAATEINRLRRRFNELDNLPNGTGIESNYREAEMEDIQSRIEILCDGLSLKEARSLGGAYAQMVQLWTNIECARALVYSDAEAKELYRQQKRLAWSILSIMKQHIPVSTLSSMGDPSEHLNPWRPYQERLATIGRAAI